MKKFIFIFISMIIAQIPKDYFQQHVSYDIEVSLNDSSHTLSGFESIVYTNNSPDTLDFIWFHLWPNAYKNTETAFAKQRERFLNPSFIFSDEKNRGYIDSIDFHIDGKKVDWTYHNEWIDVAKINLNKPLYPNNKIIIETPFFVKLPKVFSRLGHTGKHYEITQWYPKPAVYDSKGWHPMPYLDMGEFYSEFGTFDVKITLPENYRIMATGDLINGEKEYRWLDSLAAAGDSLHALDKKEFNDAIEELISGNKKNLKEKITSIFKKSEKKHKKSINTKTLHFYQKNVHDFAWFADPNWIVRKGYLNLKDSTHKVTLWSMYLPKNAKKWENSIEYLHDSGYWYSQFCGDYPYNHITAVDGDMSAGGGMEYPNITVISQMSSKHTLEMVIMHEVGHNWFYGILGSNERDHAWMDEGLNEMNNIRYWYKKYANENARYIQNELLQTKLGPFSIGKNMTFGFFEYMGYNSWVKLGDEEPLETSSNDFKRRANYWLSYSKPLIYSWHLLDYLGEEKINQIMQNYYEDWKYKHPYPENYFSYFPKYSNKNLNWYTYDVFYNTGTVDYSVKLKNNKAIFYNNGTLTLPFEAAFFNKQNQEIYREWFEDVKDQKSINLSNEIKYVVIDPDKTLPDINPGNNPSQKPIKFTWLFDQPQYYKNEWFFMPWLFHANNYNGFTPGLNLFNGYVPGYNHGIRLLPMWDFKNEQIIGKLKLNKTNYQFSIFNFSDLNLEFNRHSGQEGIHLTFEGQQKKHLKRYPVWKTKVNLHYNNILKGSTDSTYYSSGKIITSNFGVNMLNRPNPFMNYSFYSNIKFGLYESNFSKIDFSFKMNYRIKKNIRTSIRFWIGGFFDKQIVPKQYLNYLSGNIDPEFLKENIFNRTTVQNDLSIGSRQFVAGGAGMHGIILDKSSQKLKGIKNWAMSFNSTFSLPKIPGKIFADAAIVINDNFYFNLGWQTSIGLIRIYVPLYQNWDQLNSDDKIETIVNRIRFSIGLPNLNLRQIF